MKKELTSVTEVKGSAISGFLQKSISLDPGFLTKTSQIQLGYGIWVNMAQVAIGLGFGLTAVQVPQLSAPDSSIPITRTEASWIASIMPLFSPIGCLLSGYLVDRFGRRVVLILCQAPMFIGWIYTATAKTPEQVIIGRAITGLGCGMAMGPPRIFSTEISLPNMRGVIGAFPTLGISIGISTQAFLGQFYKWQTLCFICCGFTLINFLLNNLLPETPYYVLKTKCSEEARQCLQKFRAKDYDLEKEMNQLREFKEYNDIRKLTTREHLTALFSKSSCKPFSLIIVYILITQISGTSVVLLWTIDILTAANSSYDVQSGNFLVSLTRLFFGIVTSVLLFKVGRKPLSLLSAVGVTCSCFTVAGYLTYNHEPSIVPLLVFMLYMAFASLGYNILPLLMASELYPLQVRGVLNGITVSITCLLIFGTTKSYPLLEDNLGLIYTMVVFGFCSLLGSIFLYFFLPETKELTLQEIEEYYHELRPSLVSQRRLITFLPGTLGRHLGKSTEHITENAEKTKKVTAKPKGTTHSSKLKTKEAIKIEDDSYLKKYAKAIELQRSKESVKSKQSLKSKESLRNIDLGMELMKNESPVGSAESLVGRQPKRESKDFLLKRPGNQNEKDKVLKEIKKGESNTTMRSNESKKTEAKRKGKEGDLEDKNQPNTSKK